MGLGLGAMFSLMSSSFAYEDPLRRDPTFDTMKFDKKARVMFREMGRGMWTTGKGFGKVGALYAGLECCVESVNTPPSLFPSHIHKKKKNPVLGDDVDNVYND
jgi:import inner membrane translocase subunit TIM22